MWCIASRTPVAITFAVAFTLAEETLDSGIHKCQNASNEVLQNRQIVQAGRMNASEQNLRL